MADQFTLGIEEEFQLVKQSSGELCSCAQSILDKSAPYFEEKIKPEMLQSTLEYVSDDSAHCPPARKELYSARSMLSRLVQEEGMALVSAGTHPSALWMEQELTEKDRYIEMEEEYQDVGRSILIFGLHVHVAVQDKELAIKVMNQVKKLVAPDTGSVIQFTLLEWAYDGHQVVSLGRLEALSSQRNAGCFYLLESI